NVLNFDVGNCTTFATAIYTFTFVTGTWYHIVGTFDGATVTLYVNGASVATASLTGSIAAGTNVISFGYNVATGSGFLAATMDECATYTSALSASRVASHYNSGQGQQDRDTAQLAQADISFPRGTFHRLRAKSLTGMMSMYF